MNVGTWQPSKNLAIARALAITKPIPYNPNGVWEATVQNVADSLGLAMHSSEREAFVNTSGVEKPTPDVLDNLITEGQYSPVDFGSPSGYNDSDED